MTSEIKDQKNWQDYGLQDLRHIGSQYESESPEELKKADTVEEAIEVVSRVFGFTSDLEQVQIKTYIGDVTVCKTNIEHIVEKRNDARERYARHALHTIEKPFEIWKVAYENGDHRYAFISLFGHKRQMLVIVSIWDGNFLWNFMHTDKKGLNKHRHGELIFQDAEKQKAANE